MSFKSKGIFLNNEFLKKNPDNEVSCSQTCIKIFKKLYEHINLLKRENEELKYEGYQLRKGLKPLKEQLEAKTID